MPSRVAAAVLIERDRLLLGHRHADREHHPDVWDLPGGHIEDGETATEALIRELLEELAIDVSGTVAEPWTVASVDDIEVTVFIVNAWEGTVRNNEPTEHDALEWFRVDEVDQLPLASPLYRGLLRQAMAEHQRPVQR